MVGMWIPDENQASVAFVCMGAEPIATAFLVMMDSEEEGNAVYFVTARHVIENMPTDDVILWVNSVENKRVTKRTIKTDWYIHESADVAAISLGSLRGDGPRLELTAIPVSTFVGADYRYHGPPLFSEEGFPVFLGNDLFFLSLFTQEYGEEKISPIARFGRIARMPELVTLRRYEDSDSPFKSVCYLAESLSWGGHSGSPVEWFYPFIYHPLENEHAHLNRPFRAFLGLVSAHYGIPTTAKVTGEVLGKIQTSLNSGIAVITPSSAILELLLREDVMKARRGKETEAKKSRMPTMDVGLPEQDFTREDFENALRRVSRRQANPSEPDEASSGTSE
jgi:hypothetical protein